VIPDHQVLDLAGALETAMAAGLLERLQSLYQIYGLGVKYRLDDARDRVVFPCARLLNLGSSNELSKTDGFRTKLSELNHQAGE
jgi:hypothetical protein